MPQKALVRILGGGTLVFGLLGVARPERLASLLGAETEYARAIGVRDVGSAIALLAGGDPRPAIAQRMLYDVGDAVHLRTRKPVAAVAALAFAALGGVALAGD